MLECGHLHNGGARVSVHLCPVCKSNMIIADVQVDEWHSRCLHLKCRFSRWYGNGQRNAIDSARKHRFRHPECYAAFEPRPDAAKLRKNLVKLGVISDEVRISRTSQQF